MIKATIILFSLLATYSVKAQICPNGTYLVQSHPRQAYYRSDGTYVSSTDVSSYCRNYRDDGPLKEKFVFKKPKKWPRKQEQFKQCSKEKQQKISKILNSIPKILTNVGELKLYCSNKSEIPNNPASCSLEAKIIVLYDSSFNMDTRRVIVHELAHILWGRLSDEEKISYQNSSNWMLIQGVYVYNRTSFSEDDGKNGPEEDFANNVEHYFSNKEKFRQNFPKIYEWIHNFIKENK